MRTPWTARSVILTLLALAAWPARAEPIDHGTDLVVLGTIESLRGEELPPCPVQDESAEGARCGSVFVADVLPTEFLRGGRQERLTVHFPRLPQERELAGTHAALFLEKHGDALWIADGRAGLVTSREPFVAVAVDRLRLALALERVSHAEKEQGADAPLMVNPQEGVSLPTIVSKVKPDYFDLARAVGAEGKVLLNVVIGKDGRVLDLRVLKTAFPGWGLEIAALRAVSQWTYRPAQKEGQPVNVYMTVAVDFSLDGTPTLPQDAPPGPFAPSAHAIADALEGMVPQPRDLAPADPSVLDPEDRAIRREFARLAESLWEDDLATLTSLLHPEYLEQFRSDILAESAETLQQMFGMSDRKVLEGMRPAEMWMHMGGVAQAAGLLSSIGRMNQAYIDVEAEGDDLRHVTQRTKLNDPAAGRGEATVVTFKRDGTSWKVFPRSMN